LKDWTEAESYEYLIDDLLDGTYYFKIIALNLYGENVSNIISITIQTQAEENEDSKSDSKDTTDNQILTYIITTLSFVGLLSVLIVISRMRMKRQKK